ncbi:N-acetylmuramoyl-L-alanine amidase [Paracoccus onubensis]|uniref:1,6-anhydro-N-acetylmuramyl-L-alanine amidase AmpD n=1 Tax=Paracoccus onubensis TaxID=1675788 RepID=A0A418T1P5_9RHOB|nr:N-acetylmuramoyl-L-alanine amidase [Paracoccus onubensis]RJE87121.1 N-acetylmuramoyl-L-alanine amidase [Paracoccus onubensis]
MRITNHRLEGIDFVPARWTGGTITPEIVVLHDTAGRLEKGNSARYLADNDAKVSVHFVIERDGTITQLVPTNRRANHAGQSSFHGRHGCNDFSIGIEIVNPGKMEAGGHGEALAWWGQVFHNDGKHEILHRQTPEHGPGVWMTYTPEQIAAVCNLLETLFRDIPTLEDITTHWYISPGRKVDTNPLFPLAQVRALVLGRDDPAVIEAEESSTEEPTATMLRVATSGSGLNMRRWPSFNPNVITSIPNGTAVPALRSGVFDGRSWSLVQYDGREGWIVNSYTQPA